MPIDLRAAISAVMPQNPGWLVRGTDPVTSFIAALNAGESHWKAAIEIMALMEDGISRHDEDINRDCRAVGGRYTTSSYRHGRLLLSSQRFLLPIGVKKTEADAWSIVWIWCGAPNAPSDDECQMVEAQVLRVTRSKKVAKPASTEPTKKQIQEAQMISYYLSPPRSTVPQAYHVVTYEELFPQFQNLAQ